MKEIAIFRNFKKRDLKDQIKVVLYYFTILAFIVVMIVGIVYAVIWDSENYKNLQINIYEGNYSEDEIEVEPEVSKEFYPLKTDNLKDELARIPDDFYNIEIECTETNIIKIEIRENQVLTTYLIQEDMEFNNQPINTIENQTFLDAPNTLNLWIV